MKNILAWIARPYFFNLSIKYRLITACCVGLFVFVFLYIFRPFNLSILHVNDALQYTFFLGLISFLTVLFFLFIVPIIFKRFFTPENWNIGKNLILTFSCLIVIAVFCWVYSYLSKPISIPTASVFHFIFYALSVGIFPLVLYYIIDEKTARQKRQKIVNNLIKKESNTAAISSSNIQLVLRSKNTKEELSIALNNLVYITSEGNYVCIYIKEKKRLKELILRNTLTNISKDLAPYNTLIRCHKSYIINSRFITNIQGNARGYVLKSSIIPFYIPVSRSFPKTLLHNLVRK